MPRLPNGAKAPKKKKPAPKRKPSIKKGAEARAAIPGYKVPKKLLKNTKSNRNAARPSLAQVMRESEARIQAYNAKSKPKSSNVASKATSAKLDEMAQANKAFSKYGWKNLKDATSKVRKRLGK